VNQVSLNYQEVLASMRDQLNSDGFLPFGSIKLGKRMSPGTTLHEVFRTSMGMKPEDSVYMYWEWQELKPFVSGFWEALDLAASKIQKRRTTAVAFAYPEERTLVEILELLESVSFAEQRIQNSVSRRPTRNEASVRYVGKLLGACLHTLAILEKTYSLGYGDLLSSLALSPVANVELLRILDDKVLKAGIPYEELQPPDIVLIPRALGWAYEMVNSERAREDETQLTLAEFIIETDSSANWSGLSDQSVLRRLLTIAPENAEGNLKAIKKFLVM